MNSRHQLTLAILFCECVFLAAGLAAVGSWVHQVMSRGVAEQVLVDNQLVANQIARCIDELALNDISMGSPEWDRLQAIIADARLPNDGYLCITEGDTGKLICHPQISQPGVAELRPGAAWIDSKMGPQRVVQVVQQNGEVSGEVQYGQEIHLLAARQLNSVNANLMVHQQKRAIEKSVASQIKPFYWVGSIVGVFVLIGSIFGCFLLLKSYDLHLEHINEQLEGNVEEKSVALMRTRNAVIVGLAKLAESRDTDTGDHLDRIQKYSEALARRLKDDQPEIDTEFIQTIGFASSLHDIGKVGVPDSVLLKPGRLTAEERKTIEQHPQIGHETLLKIKSELGDDDFLDMARDICISHHEKWDGSGYPYGLVQEDIPLSARIVAVADVYDALTSKRPYKDAMSHRQAASIIFDSAGGHFDPNVVLAFQEAQFEFQEIRRNFTPQTTESPADSENTTAPQLV